jgi:hypothetical protein
MVMVLEKQVLLQAQEQPFWILVQRVQDEPYLLVGLKVMKALEMNYPLHHCPDETPTCARASWQNQFAHLVRVINLGG